MTVSVSGTLLFLAGGSIQGDEMPFCCQPDDAIDHGRRPQPPPVSAPTLFAGSYVQV